MLPPIRTTAVLLLLSLLSVVQQAFCSVGVTVAQNRQQSSSLRDAAKERLDGEIASLISGLPNKVTRAKNAVELDNQKNYFIRNTQGWAIVFASFNDAFSAMALQNKTFAQTTPVDLYRTGFTLNYGIGFGYPHLLALPSKYIYCDEYDFLRALERYGLQSGVAGAEAVAAAGLPEPYGATSGLNTVMSLASRISEFDLVVRSNLDCILSHEDAQITVNEVAWDLDRLITAMNLRMQLDS